MKVIDVSHWQGDINFASVRSELIEGVIIKAGGSDAGFYTDSKFNINYENAKANNLNVGAYYFVGKKCLSKNDGIKDAERFINIIKDKTFELPLYIDIEVQPNGYKEGVTDAIFGFCETLEKAGYFAGVYASDISGYKNKINYDRIKTRFTLWVARYGSKPTYVKSYDVWQYSSKGKIYGIDGYVDLNECYKDFPSIMKNKGYNGFKKEETKKDNVVSKKSNEEIANEVINGLWNNGEQRKSLLTKAGYDYKTIQDIVNNKVKIKKSIPIKSNKVYYTVKKGDTLSGIAKKYKTNLNTIKKLNPSIKNINKIYVAQKIRIK